MGRPFGLAGLTMPCGLCGSLDHNRSACPWAQTTQPAIPANAAQLTREFFEREFYADLFRKLMNNDDTYHDELTAHLAAQAHPQPCPPRYDHGYIRRDDMRLRDFGLARPAPARQSPGPITMHEPRSDWLGWALLLGVALLGVGGFAGWMLYLARAAK